MIVDENIDLERVVVDIEYRDRVLRYLNGASQLLSQRNIDLNRVIADAAYRREAVLLLNGPGELGWDEPAGGVTSVSWRHLQSKSEGRDAQLNDAAPLR